MFSKSIQKRIETMAQFHLCPEGWRLFEQTNDTDLDKSWGVYLNHRLYCPDCTKPQRTEDEIKLLLRMKDAK